MNEKEWFVMENIDGDTIEITEYENGSAGTLERIDGKTLYRPFVNVERAVSYARRLGYIF